MNGPPLLLNVDDDLASRYAIGRVLRGAGYEVVDAASAGQALSLIRERQPDLVLLDVNLPDVNGLELTRQLKSQKDTSGILILQHSASFVRPSDHARGLDRGADGYLTVPIETEVLLATVRSLLRARDAERALRQSAQQWRATFDAISDAVALLDRDLRVVRCNRSFRAFVQRDFPVILGTTWGDLLPGLAEPVGARQGTMAGGPRTEVEQLHEGRWIRLVVDTMRSPEGGVEGFVCVLSDIDDRKAAENERGQLLERERDARASAEAANREKDEFLAVLSHELRTPLNAVMGWARLLATESLDRARASHAASAIERNARAQAQLIDDLLDISRAVSGHLMLDAKPIDIVPVVRSAIEVVQVAADAKGVSVRLHPAASSAMVSGDERRLRQVMWNLLSNAIKFTNKGGRIEVTVTADDAMAEIRVADTGIGIARDALPHVFERFWQLDRSPGRLHAGLGLGLAIVRHLAEGHGGSVAAESAGEGQGAVFTVRIPLMT